jgi:hypothetical protein
VKRASALPISRFRKRVTIRRARTC